MQVHADTPSMSNGLPFMLEMDVDVAEFSSDWGNCDLMSTYVSKMVSTDRTDSLLFANLYSSAVNELFETAFRVHGENGSLVCKFFRNGNLDRVELSIPANDAVADFYAAAIERTAAPNANEAYLNILFQSDAIDPALGLLELVLNYGAALQLREDKQNQRVCIVAEFQLEETATKS
ncbi:hypothetical protein JM93_04309 [Roseibium hamelinense]|uniref:Ubiquinone biosynthesis methyltransferase UbiE n=2 Tax=Roseibium hamelinense TaxID=150831 RepID=A0A562SEE1_9HYPH|nr:hypothetical protein JM93_04309 [Roseibium hamelinense]